MIRSTNRKNFLAGAVVATIAVILVIKSGTSAREGDHVTPLPLVLRQVQSLGELHTTRYHYENVFEYSTHKQPSDWTEYVPVVAGIVESSTRNTALITANGSIEAGVDLAQAKVTEEGKKIVVTLPQPTVYEPVVDAKVHESAPGWFWTDDNLALKGRRDAIRRIKVASREQGIMQSARDSAIEKVEALLKPIVKGELEVKFGA